MRKALSYPGGVLVCNPLPAGDEIAAHEIAGHIDMAIEQAIQAGIAGKDLTPFLLDQMIQLTEGRSLTTNVALIRNNAALSAQIAVSLAAQN